jgi:membrane protease YdiL (CAAX protease family)
MPAPGEPRELRSLVPFEVAAVVALAIVPLPELVPVALPLLVVASASRWARGRPWSQVLGPGGSTTWVGAAAGLAALAIAVVVATPVVERMTRSTVEWSAFPVVRGSPPQLFAVALVVIAMAIATELALRGWIVERVLELAPGPPVLPVLVGAIAEGLLTPGDAWVRIGAVAFGVGLGWIYVAAGRSVVASICARVAFSLGALLLEGLRILG